MASDLTTGQVQAQPQPATGRPRRPYLLRFALLYALLAGVVGAAIAGFVLLAGSGPSSGAASGGGWSAWHPGDGSSADRSKEIAQHVARGYHLEGGGQLLDVRAGAPAVQDVPIRAFAVADKVGGVDQTLSAEVDSKNSLMFILCGLGAQCSIGKGKPSIQRGRLVRREALELALYAFKYVDGVKYIVAFMPPKRGEQPQLVVYFRRQDFGAELSRPLRETLTPTTPLQNAITAKETSTIDRLTEPHVFKFSLQQAQNGDAYLVLRPPSV